MDIIKKYLNSMKKHLLLILSLLGILLTVAFCNYLYRYCNKNEKIEKNEIDNVTNEKNNITDYKNFEIASSEYNNESSKKLILSSAADITQNADKVKKTIIPNTETKENFFPDNEMEILYRITEAEAGGEDEHGKILVANVILNRVKSKQFPNTIKDVVFDRKYNVQFTPTVNGRYNSVSINDNTIEAVHKAVQKDYSNGALYFRTTKGSKGKWHERSLTRLFSHGSHSFYK